MKTKLILSVLSATILILGISTLLPPETRTQQASATQSDKYDGGCTGHETAGRCADKCPANTSEGVYNLIGYDEQTGAAICKFHYYDPCPYADAHSANSAVCKKLEAQQKQPQPRATVPEVNTNQYGGK